MTIEVYSPKFDDFHDTPMVTWRDEPNRDVRIAVNLFHCSFRWSQMQSWLKPSNPIDAETPEAT